MTDSRLFWSTFDDRRTREAGGKADMILFSIVNLTAKAGSSQREDLEEMARSASKPFPLASISKSLDETRSIRGRSYFGYAGRLIDEIVDNYPGMRWWMAKDGLVIDIVSDDADRLSEFDRRAGQLVWDGMQAGKLSEHVLKNIAAELDAARFPLLKNLQPAQRKAIAAFNQKYAKRAVKSFSAAAAHPRLSCAVRRRLYVARARYRAAYKSDSS
jgi:hypothetical protein